MTASGPVDERFCNVGNVELCYQTFGDPGDPAMLMIMGLGTQMIGWHEDLCAQLAGRGFFVIRYDNRDVGRSTRFDDTPPPGVRELLRRRPRNPAYDLGDMAADAAGLLDCLEIEAAHVVGASMGGMIAQLLAARHPHRVLSLTSIMSSTGSRWAGQPALRAYPYLVRSPGADRDAVVERAVSLFRLVGSQGFPFDEQGMRERAGLSYDRGFNPAGTGRQLAAVLATGLRTGDLKRIKAPTLVIHGTVDRLVAPSGGRATARHIPGARLEMIEGMGHDLPRGAWPRIVDLLVEHAHGAQPAPAASASAAARG